MGGIDNRNNWRRDVAISAGVLGGLGGLGALTYGANRAYQGYQQTQAAIKAAAEMSKIRPVIQMIDMAIL